MSKHTPGPWAVGPAKGSNGQALYLDITPSGPYRGQVASVFDAENIEGITVAEADANARLIAAAPDLLEALKALAAEMVASGNAGSTDYGWKPAIEKTRAALAKAEAA